MREETTLNTLEHSPAKHSSEDALRSYIHRRCRTVTYGHRLRKIGHPVRSAIHKPQIGRLVAGSVTTSEYLLLYVFWVPLLSVGYDFSSLEPMGR